MPPLRCRSGARERSDRCQYWVWSRGGELGRTALTKHARTRPGSFLGIRRILPQAQRPPPPGEACPALDAGVPRRGGGGSQPPLHAGTRSAPLRTPLPEGEGWSLPSRRRGMRALPRAKPKPPAPSAGSRADECQERAGDDLFSARGRPPSIVGAAAFHFRVRDGNGWSHRATITSSAKIVPRDSPATVLR